MSGFNIGTNNGNPNELNPQDELIILSRGDENQFRDDLTKEKFLLDLQLVQELTENNQRISPALQAEIFHFLEVARQMANPEAINYQWYSRYMSNLMDEIENINTREHGYGVRIVLTDLLEWFVELEDMYAEAYEYMLASNNENEDENNMSGFNSGENYDNSNEQDPRDEVIILPRRDGIQVLDAITREYILDNLQQIQELIEDNQRISPDLQQEIVLFIGALRQITNPEAMNPQWYNLYITNLMAEIANARDYAIRFVLIDFLRGLADLEGADDVRDLLARLEAADADDEEAYEYMLATNNENENENNMSGFNGEINWDNPNEQDFQAMMDSVDDDGIIGSPDPTTREGLLATLQQIQELTENNQAISPDLQQEIIAMTNVGIQIMNPEAMDPHWYGYHTTVLMAQLDMGEYTNEDAIRELLAILLEGFEAQLDGADDVADEDIFIDEPDEDNNNSDEETSASEGGGNSDTEVWRVEISDNNHAIFSSLFNKQQVNDSYSKLSFNTPHIDELTGTDSYIFISDYIVTQ